MGASLHSLHLWQFLLLHFLHEPSDLHVSTRTHSMSITPNTTLRIPSTMNNTLLLVGVATTSVTSPLASKISVLVLNVCQSKPAMTAMKRLSNTTKGTISSHGVGFSRAIHFIEQPSSGRRRRLLDRLQP